ncbi:MAG: S8 family serine peptidase [Alphaproteobacteria bacterium]|nr:S8 family serine peptidase [Alphaproteobacteria bacterium]
MADKRRTKRGAPRAGKDGSGRRKAATTRPSRRADAGEAGFVIRSLRTGTDAPLALGARAESARTLVYVHGIGNKPRESVLKCQWDTALFGHAMGDRTRLAYWVNRDYYPEPEDATCASPDRVRVEDDEVSTRTIMALAQREPDAKADAEALGNEIDALAGGNAGRRRTLDRIAERMISVEPPVEAAPAFGMVRPRILPFEWFRRIVVPKLTRAFLRDVNDFLYDADRRAAMLQSLADRLASGGGPFVVVGHSQGSMIAYEVLRRLDPQQFEVPLFVTIGSPLGIQEVQDVLKEWSGGRLEPPRCVGKWLNVADPRDVVAIDPELKDDFGRSGKITDLKLDNPDSPQHPHSGTGYLRLPEVRTAVAEAVGAAFGQAIAPFVVAGDLVEQIENGTAADRHPVLIQLAVDRPTGRGVARDLDAVAADVKAAIGDMLQRQQVPDGQAAVDRLQRYITARLTRLEVETLRSRFRELKIEGIWRNAPKRAFISRSTHTVQARPANLGYGADGDKIAWAVLDTGIRADHPHFELHGNVAAQYDCTQPGTPAPLGPKDGKAFAELDGNGHGTHVAAIIGGSCRISDDGPDGNAAAGVLYAGMAPKCALYGFKVLDDAGNGQDSSIIKALDVVADLNERAGQLMIHGVNLSLGGSFDPAVFGCGHTPLCQELRRLWRQGVLVCLAAGNEGYTLLRAQSGFIQANMDITIGDPANLEEAIAVGSVHKTNPHTYGISHFSSRGPTADGRRKPDVVAPGERVVAARHDWQRPKAKAGQLPRLQDLYIEMSGTSMATPHVSGILAAFLSLRREFIGYPDRVKKILMDSCIDLGRDAYMQGAGLPNLIKMLALN